MPVWVPPSLLGHDFPSGGALLVGIGAGFLKNLIYSTRILFRILYFPYPPTITGMGDEPCRAASPQFGGVARLAAVHFWEGA
jgi:hypothetical protein